MLTDRLRRRKGSTAVTPVPTGPVGAGKGRATPTRRTSQAARKQPLVPAAPKRAGKGASKADKAAVRADRVRSRELMMAGDERHLPARDRGPVRKTARDVVDSRWNVGEFLLPVMLVVVLLSFSGLQTRAPQTYLVIVFIVYGMLLVSALDGYLLSRRVKKVVVGRLGAGADTGGVGMYSVLRAFQLRRSRIPRPAVKRGGRRPV